MKRYFVDDIEVGAKRSDYWLPPVANDRYERFAWNVTGILRSAIFGGSRSIGGVQRQAAARFDSPGNPQAAENREGGLATADRQRPSALARRH